MKYIGAHVSASGGVEFAPVNAHEIEQMLCVIHQESTPMGKQTFNRRKYQPL